MWETDEQKSEFHFLEFKWYFVQILFVYTIPFDNFSAQYVSVCCFYNSSVVLSTILDFCCVFLFKLLYS